MLSHKITAFLGHQDERTEITSLTVLSNSAVYLISEYANPTSYKAHARSKKECLWRVYDALKLPNINISNCPFVCHSRRFIHAEAMHHSKMAKRYAFVLFSDLRCIDWFNHNPCVTHHWSMHGSLLLF